MAYTFRPITSDETPDACTYGDSDPVVYAFRTVGGTVEGVCTWHAGNFGCPQYLQPVNGTERVQLSLPGDFNALSGFREIPVTEIN